MDMGTDDHLAQVVTFPQYPHPRHVPDVPQDVDYLMDHLNDPNYDIRNRSKSATASSYSLGVKKGEDLTDFKHDFETKSTDLDTESQVESTRYSTTSMSDFTDFDEYVIRPKF
jgi:hypothetical protein